MGQPSRMIKRRVALVAAVMTFASVLGGGSPAEAAVSAVQGSAFGVYVNAVVPSFSGTYGPTPAVTLPPAGSGTLTDTDPSADVIFGPAEIFSSGGLSASTQGTTGQNGSVTSSTSVTNVNKNGAEVFTAASIQSTCSAAQGTTSGRTTVSGGTLYTDSGRDLNFDGDYIDAGEHAPVFVNIPAQPAPNTTYTGHIHVGNTTDNFTYVFNEQVINPNGSITVNAAHQYLQGPLATGDLVIGQVVCGVTAPREAVGDYNGDGTTDIAVYRPSTGVWYVQSPFQAVKWGEPGDIPVPGDYDGNGTTEQAVYRPSTGVWYLYGPPFRATLWGEPGDIPVPGDYDDNGTTDVAVYRPSTGVWFVQSPFQAVKWGEPGDIPVPGDYDGNGSTEFAVYRPSTGVWYLYGPPFRATVWGEPGDVPVPGDYDGNGTTDVAVYRPSTGVWYVQSPFQALKWGDPGDVPVPGDYDGNGITEFAVYRPSTGVWYLYGPPFRAYLWGEPGDIPLPLPHAIYRFFF